MSARLSDQEQRALDALKCDVLTSVDCLAVVLRTSESGAARTAGSLVRKGFVLRVRDRGRVAYLLSPQEVAS